MSSKNNYKKKKVAARQMVEIPSQATLVAPVSPFTDFTNFQMLFQQQYPAAQLFVNPMNSLTLNKDKAEDEEVIKELVLKRNFIKKYKLTFCKYNKITFFL